MIELIDGMSECSLPREDKLKFSFPEVHNEAWMRIVFQRDLRTPDEMTVQRKTPKGMMCDTPAFPLQHVDAHADRVPKRWLEHGGVMLPMYQSEAMRIHFITGYPFAVKIAIGKINTISGQPWNDKLNRNPQDYILATKQPWMLRHPALEKGDHNRQIVAMPLGAGVTTEDQITDQSDHVGLQFIAHPMKGEAYDQYFPPIKPKPPDSVRCCPGPLPRPHYYRGLAKDEYKMEDWDLKHCSRVYVHICNSQVWHDLTGKWPPTVAPKAREYRDVGLPWCDCYDDKLPSPQTSTIFNKLKSFVQFRKQKEPRLTETEPVEPVKFVNLYPGLKPGQVRELVG